MSNLDPTLTMLKDLTDANAISGHEKEARDVMEKYIKPYADEVFTDHLGSLIAKKAGQENGPKIMVAGHLDEVGFMVTRIDKNGFVYFQTIGGWWNQVMLAQRVTIMTKDGDVTGVIGSKPPHILSAEERKKPVEIKDMFIDIGASSKEEAEKFGVRPGDSVVPYFEFTQMKNEKMLLAKAWDNRIGCAIAIDVLKKLQNEEHPNIVYGVGTIQEEVGLRGAKTSAHLIKPDIAFGVDVGIAGDTPGISDKDADSKLGKGPQIILYDASMISHKGVRDLVIETAEEKEIPFQYSLMAGGGTDSGAIHLTADGVPALSITIATRYIHSHAAMLHRDDFENAVKLIVEVIKKIDQKKLESIRLA
ncbi:M42 family metallopeptidase [Pseudogracilibacillus sp. SE30717A]|uniref:M42 family metallopeptidase n=1 Tax=Pseudogracilibacillus sp. SE30717A TaxID=3098293 RepID=UPI00300DD7D9